MTNDELLNKAIEWLRKIESHLDEPICNLKVDRLPKTRFRDAVIIDFESDDKIGSIRVFIERDTGNIVEAHHTPPKKEADELSI